MDNIKNDRYYLEKIVSDIGFVLDHTKNLKKEDLTENEVLLDSILFRLIQVAENSAKLSSNFKRAHSAIEWQSINGLRNRIVHDYGKVDLTIIYDTVVNDLPNLYNYLSGV